MAVNGSAIRGTQASPFAQAPAWGRITSRKTVDADGKPLTELNLLVFEWPVDAKLRLPETVGALQSAHLLANGAELEIGADAQGPFITLPQLTPDSDVSVVRVLERGHGYPSDRDQDGSRRSESRRYSSVHVEQFRGH